MVEIERDNVLSWRAVVIGWLGIGIGWYLADCFGSFIGLLASVPVGLAVESVFHRSHRIEVPEDAESCIDAAVVFAKSLPVEGDVKCAALRAVQDDALIVAVYHGRGCPQPRSYFRVQRADLVVTAEDRRTWWPRGLK